MPGSRCSVLETKQLSVKFGGVHAVESVSLHLREHEILGLIGPNGAGKTTLVNAISGFQAPSSGNVLLDGTPITRWPSHRRARAGLIRTFQGVRLFPTLSVLENVEAGALAVGASRDAARRSALRLLEEFSFANRSDSRAADLPQGDQRVVGIIRALSARPKFLLLDEPAAGLDDVESAALAEMLKRVRTHYKCALCIIEHRVPLIMSLCERVHVLASGRTLAEGEPRAIRRDRAVIEAYLGGGEI